MNRTRLIALALLLSAAGFLSLSCDNEKDIPPLPPAPASPGWLEIIAVTDTSVTLRWQNIPDNELGYIIYIRPDTVWSARDTVAANIREATIYDLLPDRTYGFRVTAYNEYGESAPTNEREAHTLTPPLPRPPIDVEAVPQSATSVLVTWTGLDNPDGFLVARRAASADWTTLDTTDAAAIQYTDFTTVAQTTYYYRVGALRAAFVVWSDSATAQTPAVGVPVPPDQLAAQVVLGVGVILSWRDRSDDEIRFDIGRGPAGQFTDSIGTVSANTTSFTDSLDQPGHYYYRVRAANEHGVSAWSAAAEAVYRFCSDGVVPICLDNFWEYSVDSSGGQSSMRRYIADFEFIGGDDYYLIAQSPLFGGQPDSLYYVRNYAGSGCFMVDHPLPATPLPDLMFRYPTGPSGDYYRALGDCVVVLNASPGISIPIGDTTFTGVISYQRFRGGGRSTQYWIRPSDVGVVRETDYYPGAPPVTVTRDLTRYHVTNE